MGSTVKIVAIALVSVFLGAVGAVAYTLYTQRQSTAAFEPAPIPPALLAAEDALAVPWAVGLMHVNVGDALRAESAILGAADSGALIGPVTDGNAFLRLLQEGGIDLRGAVSHVLGALVVTGDGAGGVGVVLGDFPVERIADLLPRAFEVEHATAGGEPVLILMREDVDTCKRTGPVALHLTPKRLVLGTPDLVGVVLERYAQASRAGIDLAAWREYRANKLLSLALLVPPAALEDAATDPMSRRFAEAARAAMPTVEAIFVGVSVATQPPEVGFEARLDTTSDDWPQQTVRAYQAWRDEFEESFTQTLPALARLQRHASVEADGRRLVARASLTSETIHDAADVPAEFLTLMFSGFNVRPAAPAAAPGEERLLAPEQIPSYRASLSHDDLASFDPEAVAGFESDAAAGPFGLRVKGFRLVGGDEEVVEIELEVTSGEIPNLGADSMHRVDGDGRAQLFVTAVRDRDGANLLREESCGRERNGVGGRLDPTTRSMYVNNAFKSISVVSGSKSVRLRPGARVTDIAGIEGHLRLRLPSRIETRRVEAPFAERVVEAPEVRLKFGAGDPGTLEYEISGRPDRIIAVRGLNASRQYLAGAGSYSSGRFLGSGKSVGRSFQGVPAIAELIIAREEAVRDYPFTLGAAAPRFGSWTIPEPFAVATTAKDAFMRDLGGTDLAEACENGAGDDATRPFAMCLESVETGWGSNLQGRLRVYAPATPALRDNFSALELVVEGVRVKGADGAGDRVVPLAFRQFIVLQQTYGQDYLDDGYSAFFTIEDAGALKNETITGLKGRLIVRLPTRLAAASLDARELGSRGEHPAGVGARLVEIVDGQLGLDIAAQRDRLVQLLPRDAGGAVLATSNARLESVGDGDALRGSVAVSGVPASLGVVFAEAQESLELPFDITLPD